MSRPEQTPRPAGRYAHTKHAQMRRSQRAISDLQVDLIHYFGVDHYQTGGSTLCFIPERTLSQLRAAIDRCNHVALVKGGQEEVITAMRLHQRVERTEWTA